MTVAWYYEMTDDELATWRGDDVMCPYCRTIFEEGHEFFDYFKDGETTEIKCYECGKFFIAEVNIEVSYTTYKREEDDI
jgi:uncharacterized Zn-finger protein